MRFERRNRTIHSRMRHLFELKHSDIYETSILPLGDGIALSVKRRTSGEVDTDSK